MKAKIREVIAESIAIKEALLQDSEMLSRIEQIAAACVTSLRQQGKILFAGNGGSAADAQHLAAELSGRFYLDRDPLNAEALHVNTSFLTAVANDYSFEETFARLVRAIGKKGDILFVMSTSGNSPNILRAAEDARKIGIKVVAMTGLEGGKLPMLADFLIKIPSQNTPRIQEGHMLLGHAICELIEREIFGHETNA